MACAKRGDKVRIHYTGTLADGTEFDSSREREPLVVTLGEGEVIAGFEQAVIGLEVGEAKTVALPASEAYGEHDARLVQDVERESIPAHIALETGVRLQAAGPDGEPIGLTVVAFTDETVTLDGNHPLAGKDLTFDIELVEIV